ncbi:MAG TPA: cation:proton antiporter, partial [Candidatus Tumulicola sp.]|nr:cation:proton antiporter [Candidatus Tumulicola sp.]
MKLWQILAIVALGVGIDGLAPGRFSYAFGHATLYVFLPPLLFEAAWNLRLAAVRRTWRIAALLAGPGVVVTALIVAGALLSLRVSLGAAFLAGAILSATDPIAVVAVLRRVRVPVALAT